MYIRSKKDSWKSKRIKAMNRVISKSKTKKETTENYLAEYNRVCVSNAENKQQYKGENKCQNNT
jgi:hypothetical protein